MVQIYKGDESGAHPIAIRNEGTVMGKASVLDFVGPGFDLTVDHGIGVVTATNPAITLAAQSLKPTAASYATFPRAEAIIANAAALTSGTLFLVAAELPAGAVITNLTFISGTQAAVTPTNQWFGLFSAARVALAFTDDDLTTAWAASSEKMLALSAPYTILTSGVYYFGIMVAATTAPSLQCLVYGTTTVANLAPILQGTANAAQTAVPALPFTASAITVTANRPYAYTS